MIIVISTAPHYLLMLMAGPAGVSRLSRGLRLAMFAGRKNKCGCGREGWRSFRGSCWSQFSWILLCVVVTQHEAWQ